MTWYINKFEHCKFMIQLWLVKKVFHSVSASRSSWEGNIWKTLKKFKKQLFTHKTILNSDTSSWHSILMRMLKWQRTTADCFWFVWKWKDGLLEKQKSFWNTTMLNTYHGKWKQTAIYNKYMIQLRKHYFDSTHKNVRLYETQVKKIVKVQSMMRAFLAKRNVANKLKAFRQVSGEWSSWFHTLLYHFQMSTRFRLNIIPTWIRLPFFPFVQ